MVPISLAPLLLVFLPGRFLVLGGSAATSKPWLTTSQNKLVASAPSASSPLKVPSTFSQLRRRVQPRAHFVSPMSPPHQITPVSLRSPASSSYSSSLRGGSSARTVSTKVGPLGYVAGCTLPTCLGFWRSEYGVSYGYGGAMLATALQILPLATTPLAKAHALAVAIYGLRLVIFLLGRELFIPRFQKFRDRIEKRAQDRGGRLKRLPFILGCSFLYAGMAAPLLLTATAGLSGKLAFASVVAMYVGLFVAAWGDLVKTWVKADKGGDHLVTSGPFALLSFIVPVMDLLYMLWHPNYTGEVLLWTANVFTALAAGNILNPARGGIFALSLLGLVGINFVLAQATTGLERRQSEKYGATDEYKEWVKRTWSGPLLPGKSKKNPEQKSELGDNKNNEDSSPAPTPPSTAQN
eukprot:jgi/Bigna1/91520/estExt_fgenesh1_pg.C_1040021